MFKPFPSVPSARHYRVYEKIMWGEDNYIEIMCLKRASLEIVGFDPAGAAEFLKWNTYAVSLCGLECRRHESEKKEGGIVRGRSHQHRQNYKDSLKTLRFQPYIFSKTKTIQRAQIWQTL
jgi:hypothetical protein